jgi:hypothetical protein
MSADADTSAAVTAAYNDLRPWIVATAARFARQYQWPPDDCVGWANLFFLEAYHSHNPARGGLRQRVCHRIWWGLFEIHRTWCRRNAICRQLRLTERHGRVLETRLDAEHEDTTSNPRHNRIIKEWLAVTNPATPFEERDLAAGDDAREVLCLLLHTPVLDADVRADPNTSPGSVRRHLRRHLRAAGWDGRRIEAAFAAVRAALA